MPLKFLTATPIGDGAAATIGSTASGVVLYICACVHNCMYLKVKKSCYQLCSATRLRLRRSVHRSIILWNSL